MLDTDLSSLAFARFSIDVLKKKKIRVVASIKNNFRRAISEYREINEKFFETGKKSNLYNKTRYISFELILYRYHRAWISSSIIRTELK